MQNFDLGCKKRLYYEGFKILLPKAKVYGIEDHIYPIFNSGKRN